MRALELCKLIQSEQTLNLALKYTMRIGNTILAEKITTIIENVTNIEDRLEDAQKLYNNPSTSYK